MSRIIVAPTNIQIEDLILNAAMNEKREKLSRASRTLATGEWSS